MIDTCSKRNDSYVAINSFAYDRWIDHISVLIMLHRLLAIMRNIFVWLFISAPLNSLNAFDAAVCF